FPAVPNLSAEMANASKIIAQALAQADRPAVVSGTGIRSKAILEAAANVACALHQRNTAVTLCLTASATNSFGIGLMQGKPLSHAFTQMGNGAVNTVVVLENDLFRRADSEMLK